MNTRSIAFLLATAAGICLAASQLKANDSVQPDEVAQDVGEPLDSDQCGVERTVLDAWMICEEWMSYEEAIAIDEVIEPTVAEETVSQGVDGTLADASDGIVCTDKAVEPEGIPVAEETIADELLESDEAVSEETVQVDDDKVQVSEQAAAEEAETSEEEIFASEELTEDAGWDDGFYEGFGEGEYAAEDLFDEEIAVEGNVEVVEPAVEEAILDYATDNVETEESAVAQTTEEVTINGDFALDAGPSSEESVDVEARVGEPTEGSSEQKIDEEITVEETVDAVEAIEVVSDIEALETATEEATAVEESVETAEVLDIENAVGIVEPTIEEETAVEETFEAMGDVASPVAVETLDEQNFEQEAVGEVQDATDAYEDLKTDGVVHSEESLEVVEPLIEEAGLPEAESESTAGDDVSESDSGTVRTFELAGCKITIQSERQMDDFELLNMLWKAVDQLEAEMD